MMIKKNLSKSAYAKNNGFTLIEVAMVLAIIVIISGPAARFFKAQMESSLYESKRQAFRSEFFSFMMKLRWEVRQAEKKSMEIVDNSSSNELKFTYLSMDTNKRINVGYFFDRNNFLVKRILYDGYDWNNASPVSENVVFHNVQEPHLAAARLMFEEENDFDVIMVTVAPHGRSPIPNGSVKETFSTKIASRNVYPLS